MSTAAILPVKNFLQAKQRLSQNATAQLRCQLAGAMVGDVLQALSQTPSIDQIITVTNETSLVKAAGEMGAVVLKDTAKDGQSAAALIGLRYANAHGFARALCVPGDCPALDPFELEELLLSVSERQVLIVPDRHGSGTNGLMLSPVGIISPSFGPDSRARHERLALEAGVRPQVHQMSSLLLDIDTGEDLQVLTERLLLESTRAPRTRALLAAREKDWQASAPAA